LKIHHLAPQVSFILGNAEDLSTIEDNSIDLYTIAFGIRNCTHIDRVLKEAYRVLKPGGVFSCLEFSKVTNPILGPYVSQSSLIPHPHYKKKIK
jgi:2-methoxy-6-polyprenyl-1,4-benzoquinol methylase